MLLFDNNEAGDENLMCDGEYANHGLHLGFIFSALGAAQLLKQAQKYFSKKYDTK